ncbi:SAF domain-containing protein [Streptomyces sp. NPDC020681]|uniref:SAF domain-containing protein n=1 Tax=Streptomyces sp. NPDC020681 TaxID=3365083 RepID=UPI0037AC097E
MSKTANSAAATGTGAQPGIPPAAVAFPARRRRPGMAALAAALIAAGGVGGFVAWQETGQRTEVLAVARDVPAGDVIEEADLTEAAVSMDPVLKPLRIGERDTVVGKRAAVTLVPGTLLSRGQVTDRALVEPGEQLVGIGFKSGQLPATRLSAGDRVLMVFTAGDDAPGEKAGTSAEPPRTVSARVVRVGERQQATGDVVVDVAVNATDGPALAAKAATGRVALVVDAGSGS